MAQTSYHTQVPARPRRKPDPRRVVESYYHQVQTGGKRGAYRRCGELYNISDETVRRFVHAHEQRATAPPEPEELKYVPPPFAYPEPEPATVATELATAAAPLPQDTPQNTAATSGDITSTSITNSALESGMCELATDATPHGVHATRHTAEPDDEPELAPELPHTSAPQPDLPTSTDIYQIGRSAPPVQRVVVRVPVDRAPAGLVGWLREHEAARQQAIAVAVFLVLVLLTWLG